MTIMPDILQHPQLRDGKANCQIPILFHKIGEDPDIN